LKKRIPFIKNDIFDLVDFSVINNLTKAAKKPKTLQLLELSKTKLPHLLRYEDRNSMLNSVETRLPFLDYKLVELMVSLPFHHKIKNGWTKYILRKAASKVLPESISWRRNKFGFEAPEDIWLKDKEFITKEISQSEILKYYITKDIVFDNTRLIWRLLNVAIWEKCYNVKY